MFGDNPEHEPGEASFVRPFVVTRGRTVGVAGDIPLETMVVACGPGDRLGRDHRAVVDFCSGTPQSVMEIALGLDQPIGVARVLVADLTASGHVEQHETADSENAAIVQRLLDGIRSL